MFKKLTEIAWPKDTDALAKLELEDARRALLEAHSAVEYSQAMLGYHAQRVERLTKFTEVANA